MIRKVIVVLGRSMTLYLILAMLIISSIPSQTAAMFITPEAEGLVIDSETDMDKVKTFLESKIVQQRLADFGLTGEEISHRLNQLSPEQLHRMATHIDQVDFGGDALGGIITIIVIIILIVVVLKLLGHQIVIK